MKQLSSSGFSQPPLHHWDSGAQTSQTEEAVLTEEPQTYTQGERYDSLQTVKRGREEEAHSPGGQWFRSQRLDEVLTAQREESPRTADGPVERSLSGKRRRRGGRLSRGVENWAGIKQDGWSHGRQGEGWGRTHYLHLYLCSDALGGI